jgi:hypothetical protein
VLTLSLSELSLILSLHLRLRLPSCFPTENSKCVSSLCREYISLKTPRPLTFDSPNEPRRYYALSVSSLQWPHTPSICAFSRPCPAIMPYAAQSLHGTRTAFDSGRDATSSVLPLLGNREVVLLASVRRSDCVRHVRVTQASAVKYSPCGAKFWKQATGPEVGTGGCYCAAAT